MSSKTDRGLFTAQKLNAKDRGIEFNFTFEEWVRWWIENLGPRWKELRGKKRGQYVMARNHDRGPYEPGNVKCILSEDNHIEAWKNGLVPKGEGHPSAKLDESQAIEIKLSKETTKELSKRFNVSRLTINDIKSGRRWKHLGGS